MFSNVHRLSIWRRLSDGANREVISLCFSMHGRGRTSESVTTCRPTPAGVDSWEWRGGDYKELPLAVFLAGHEQLSRDEQERARRYAYQVTLEHEAREKLRQLARSEKQQTAKRRALWSIEQTLR